MKNSQSSDSFVLKIKNITINVKDYELPYYFTLLIDNAPDELFFNNIKFNRCPEEIRFKYIHNQDFVNIENLSEIKKIVELIKNL